MSLERKDLRIKLDPGVHAQLSLVADAKGLDMAEYVEALIARNVQAVIAEATLIAERANRLGKAGSAIPGDVSRAGRIRE